MSRVYIFYHFLHPDDVVSAVIFGQLASGLAARGWDVTAFPSNRGRHHEAAGYPSRELWQGVNIRRLWRPDWSQTRGLYRVLNSCWMIVRWSILAMDRSNKPDVLIVGSDPVFGVLIAPVWRFFKPQTKIAHWCFDLYPEAAYADDLLKAHGRPARLLQRLLKYAYRACDLLVDIGPYMRSLLAKYESGRPSLTIVPWAQAEPETVAPLPQPGQPSVFEDDALTLMYSGSFGRPHSYQDMLELMRILRPENVHLALSIRGNREVELRSAIQASDTNVHFLPFAPAGQLEERLASADIHVVTLRDQWSGTVVPSKFFGALAIGRPVLFCGSKHSDIAQWIIRFRVGWVLAENEAAATAQSLQAFLRDPAARYEMNERCHRIYHQHFSKLIGIETWHKALRSAIEPTLPLVAPDRQGEGF